MLRFAKVKANLVYIQEEDLKPEFQHKLCAFSKIKEPLIVIVQLKEVSANFKPLINNLKEIRKDKAKKKVINWIKICFSTHQNLTVKVIDFLPTTKRLSLDLEGINRIAVYQTKNGGENILPLLKKRFDPQHFELNYFS
ncbi:hypothetical protein CW751_04135 [Brumimicrobium salinarum]|uniref:Uncharacterized protein n=1 Tax=Brumimicrobium salinarum TaxID=2058658 RepID=A0A2I0R564_9FLAO|nr:hypothetical protein [Brumimicrobium salinarum]PKR81724.1 hypothetical protein CW751_04135 [Brumimicrobium salinarum]